MAKVKLGSTPETFKKDVSFPMLDGSTGSIECEFIYRTRTQFGTFIDGLFADAGEAPPADGAFSMEKLMSKTRDKNADYLAKVLKGWNLDEELTPAALKQLSDELPAAVAAIMEAYRAAVVEGRLGN